ncbi:hypothetical protein BMF94_5555 [Rhodotorula taiwanensis]|uniref:Intradiol ring-cleavage dioxygenases domain-containing protein n=1 Tax=Rhodotorula taiwanensis TaxID=741276 RepID=A0A2S5B382_9BASI|nr:hypothetical protein BMF94_5555 [Rhodotorula taiwanensis]
MKASTFALALAALASSAFAHDDVSNSPERIKYLQSIEEKMYACGPKIAKYQALRKRTTQHVLNGGAAPTDAKDLFVDGGEDSATEASHISKTLLAHLTEEPKIQNHSCILAPMLTEGPYYHSAGHPIRQNMAEDQLGFPFFMDVGIIDVNTCEPMPNVLVDLWHANTTGHYAGHPDQEAHLKWEGPATDGPRKGLLTKYPRTNDHETFLRAAWPTNDNGLAQFSCESRWRLIFLWRRRTTDTPADFMPRPPIVAIFPGYYTGRATHVHIRVHTEWEPLQNGTFLSNRMLHTGQLFVPDSINMQVDKMFPYNLNPIADKWGRTRNWADSLGIYHDAHGNGYNPEFELVKVGAVLQQGLIGYITVGVDSKANFDVNAPWKPIPDNVAARLNKEK